MSDATNQNFEQLKATIAASLQPKEVDTIPFLLLPEKYNVQSLEHLLDNPTRTRANIAFYDAESFCRYINEQKTESTRIYGQLRGDFVAVIDDNGQTPQWRDHKVFYSTKQSLAWEVWTKNNKKPMQQQEFAQFVEDNLLDIVEPEAAHILEVSRSLQANKKVKFASGIRLSNGETQFTYEEQIQGSSAKGTIDVPETFVLGLPVFENGEGYKIEARLRYRIDQGGLIMWYDLLRPEKSAEDAVRGAWGDIEKATGLKIFNGQP